VVTSACGRLRQLAHQHVDVAVQSFSQYCVSPETAACCGPARRQAAGLPARRVWILSLGLSGIAGEFPTGGRGESAVLLAVDVDGCRDLTIRAGFPALCAPANTDCDNSGHDRRECNAARKYTDSKFRSHLHNQRAPRAGGC
jgi:hypothetical protein